MKAPAYFVDSILSKTKSSGVGSDTWGRVGLTKFVTGIIFLKLNCHFIWYYVDASIMTWYWFLECGPWTIYQFQQGLKSKGGLYKKKKQFFRIFENSNTHCVIWLCNHLVTIKAQYLKRKYTEKKNNNLFTTLSRNFVYVSINLISGYCCSGPGKWWDQWTYCLSCCQFDKQLSIIYF